MNGFSEYSVFGRVYKEVMSCKADPNKTSENGYIGIPYDEWDEFQKSLEVSVKFCLPPGFEAIPVTRFFGFKLKRLPVGYRGVGWRWEKPIE